MGYLPFIFKRRTGEEKQGDLLGFIVLKVCVPGETDICIGIESAAFLIDWGDGISDNLMQHRYEQAGEYTLRIVGTAIHWLDISKCHVAGIYLRKCFWLEQLLCDHNHLQILDISHCPALRVVDCAYNVLVGLRLGRGQSLKSLDCSHNVLQHLEIGHCKQLKCFYSAFNLLTQLDFYGCEQIRCVDIGNNRFTAEGLNRLYESLPELNIPDTAAVMLEQSSGADRKSALDLFYRKVWKIV